HHGGGGDHDLRLPLIHARRKQSHQGVRAEPCLCRIPRCVDRALPAAAGGAQHPGRRDLEDPYVAGPDPPPPEHRGRRDAPQPGRRSPARDVRFRGEAGAGRHAWGDRELRRVRGGLLAALLCTAAAAGSPSAAVASPAVNAGRSVLLLFVAPGTSVYGQGADDAIERQLSSIPTLSTGILSASQGTYKADQLLLDVSQGARVAYSAYSPTNPPSLDSLAFGPPPSARVPSWPATLRRAQAAPQLLEPGLLATSIPGGAAYAAPYELGGPNAVGATIDVAARAGNPVSVDWPLAADRSGKIAAVSFGSAAALLARIDKLGAAHSLVVADLPGGTPGDADLRALAAGRPPGELLGVVQSAPAGAGGELLWTAFAGLGGGGRTLTSQTTNQRGLIASIDIAPTILDHLGLPIPADMRGKPVQLEGSFNATSMRALKQRLEVIGGRRLPAIAWLVAAWALLLAVVHLPIGGASGRREATGTVTAAGPHRSTGVFARRAWALRVGALAIMWTPVAILLPAALEPARTAEFAMIVASCFVLAILTDGVVAWPRAPIAPAVVALLALSADALAGEQLLMRSVLGPDPILGARFYGIGNELKSALAVLVFTAVAAALYPAVRSRRTATAMACAGIVLAIVEGSARIGAGVGGVILVSAGTAMATVMLLPGKLADRRSAGRRLLIVMAAPVLGLIALAAIDLATAHGSGHFTGSVLDARSAGDIRDLIVRRYGAAWDELKNHLMPLATALAVIESALRSTPTRPGKPHWRAA